jgi:dipeptide/tripeptide permease
MLWGTLFQALEIVFEVQRKRSNEKNKKKKNKLFNLQNAFFVSFLFWTPPTFNLTTFSFFIHLNDLKCHKNTT